MNIHRLAVRNFFKDILGIEIKNKSQTDFFEKLFINFRPKYQEFFDMRYGKGKTYQECGDKLGVSRQRIEQFNRVILRVCKSYPNIKKLELGENLFFENEIEKSRQIAQNRVEGVLKQFNSGEITDYRKLHSLLYLDAKHNGYLLEGKPINGNGKKVSELKISAGSLSRLQNATGKVSIKVDTISNLLSIIYGDALWFKNYTQLGVKSILEIYTELYNQGYLTKVEFEYLKALL